MKICKFVEGSFIPAFDGASERFSQISKNLSALGVDLTVVHCYRGWSNLDTIKTQNFRTFAISPKYYYQDHSVVEKIIKRVKPDIVEMNDMELIMSTGLYINKKFGIPVVFDAQFISSVHVKFFTNSKQAVLDEINYEKMTSKIVSGVICFTKLDKDNLLKSSDVNPKRVRVIPLGSDSKTIKFREIKKSDNIILFLGNIYYQPNQDAVEYIVSKIAPIVLQNQEDVKFRFVGDIPKALIKKYQSKNIVFEGRIDDINDVFKNARVCLAPINMGSGMRVKILTYMATGIPVVATTVAAEGITDLTALSIGDNPTKFAAKILELLNDFPKSSRLGKKARTLVESVYSWENIARECLTLYKNVLKNPVISDLEPIAILNEPYWLTETIEKGRFNKKLINPEFIYVLGFGKKSKIKSSKFTEPSNLLVI